MKAEQMRAKSADELKDMIMELRKEQMTLRFQHSAQQLGTTSKLRVARRNIARAKTLLKQQAAGTTTTKVAKPAKEKTAKAAPAKKAAKAKA